MAGPPPPPDPAGEDRADLVDPDTGEPLPTGDVRQEFARHTREGPDQQEAERAFIEGKLGLIAGDPRLSDEQKRAATEELLERFRGGG